MSVPYYGDFAEDDTVNIVFNTFTSNDPSASVTITNFAAGDVHIHKDLGVSPRNNAAGITVTVDHDGITGNHGVQIDTNDNTVGGFWVTGSEYQVRIEGTTVDGGTINAFIGSFSIERAGGVLALLKAGTVKIDVETIKTQTVTCGAGVTVRADVGAAAAPGAANGMFIGGSNAETTIATALNSNIIGNITGNLSGTVAGKTPSEAGDAMNLAADAIKAVSYDESTAFPLTAVNGSTLTEAGGDGDHLTAINLPNQTMNIAGTITGNLIGDVTGNVDGTVAGVTPEAAGVAPTAAEVVTAMEVDGGDLSSIMEALVNKRIWTEANGNLEMFNDSNVSQGSVAAQVATDGTFTTAKRAFI